MIKGSSPFFERFASFRSIRFQAVSSFLSNALALFERLLFFSECSKPLSIGLLLLLCCTSLVLFGQLAAFLKCSLPFRAVSSFCFNPFSGRLLCFLDCSSCFRAACPGFSNTLVAFERLAPFLKCSSPFQAACPFLSNSLVFFERFGRLFHMHQSFSSSSCFCSICLVPFELFVPVFKFGSSEASMLQHSRSPAFRASAKLVCSESSELR